ncbi:HAUS augmin-like complex subunit 2 [Fukomys damarensis]|uniref:HAUS augmin-like complex subunit 2 n=1 Tax=Fukomys damarensis TaxID=885580 RepID=A0A091CYV2_FUKDA|nr:HAUS augmin-like complex subunit 2 [Fukomys damarensis]
MLAPEFAEEPLKTKISRPQQAKASTNDRSATHGSRTSAQFLCLLHYLTISCEDSRETAPSVQYKTVTPAAGNACSTKKKIKLRRLSEAGLEALKMWCNRVRQTTNIQVEIYQKSLEIESLELEKETADTDHPSYLAEKCHTLQSTNSHLEAVLKKKRSLRQRLLQTMCQQNLPVEAVYRRHMVYLLQLAVPFTEKLGTHLSHLEISLI